MTQLRSLKDQGFLIFKKSGKKYYITISKLGNDLIENKIDASIIYTKALIGMHANNPCRTSLLNESIPFLLVQKSINEDGLPLHCAPSSKCDIIYHHTDGSYILEPTMQRGRNQQLNNETTNIVRHMQNEKTTHGVDYRVMMVAPYIHPDVVEFFRFKAINDKVKISTLSIEKTIGLISDSENIKDLNHNYDSIIVDLKTLDAQQFVDKINTFRISI